MAPKVTVVESYEQFKEIINRDTYSMFDFWATWCAPCRVVSPCFEQFSTKEEYAHVDFYKVDIDVHDAIAQEVSIHAVPTFMMFKNGAVVDSAAGGSIAVIEKVLAKAV